jgi:hypothetical protein
MLLPFMIISLFTVKVEKMRLKKTLNEAKFFWNERTTRVIAMRVDMELKSCNREFSNTCHRGTQHPSKRQYRVGSVSSRHVNPRAKRTYTVRVYVVLPTFYTLFFCC